MKSHSSDYITSCIVDLDLQTEWWKSRLHFYCLTSVKRKRSGHQLRLAMRGAMVQADATRRELAQQGIRIKRQGPEFVTWLRDTNRLVTARSWTIGALCATAVDARNTGHSVNRSRTQHNRSLAMFLYRNAPDTIVSTVAISLIDDYSDAQVTKATDGPKALADEATTTGATGTEAGA